MVYKSRVDSMINGFEMRQLRLKNAVVFHSGPQNRYFEIFLHRHGVRRDKLSGD